MVIDLSNCPAVKVAVSYSSVLSPNSSLFSKKELLASYLKHEICFVPGSYGNCIEVLGEKSR